MRSRGAGVIAVVGAGLVLGAHGAQAFMAADLANARKVAGERCAGCHSIPEADPSGKDGVPSFVALAEDEAIANLEGLKVALAKPHWPETAGALTAKDIDDLIGYVLSLKGE